MKKLGFLFGFLSEPTAEREPAGSPNSSFRRFGAGDQQYGTGLWIRKEGSFGLTVYLSRCPETGYENLPSSVNHLFPGEFRNLDVTESIRAKCQGDNDLYTFAECMTGWETETDFSQKTGYESVGAEGLFGPSCQGRTERRNAPNAAPSNPRKLLRTSRAVSSRKMWAV